MDFHQARDIDRIIPGQILGDDFPSQRRLVEIESQVLKVTEDAKLTGRVACRQGHFAGGYTMRGRVRSCWCLRQ